MMPRYLIPLLLLALPAEAFDGPSSKATPLGQHEGWNTFVSSEGEKTCFAVLRGDDVSQSQEKASFYISNWPSNGIHNEIGINFPYVLKAGSASKITLGPNEFDLPTKGQGAFLANSDTEKRFVGDMKGQETMMVESHTPSGEKVNHRFSLLGFDDAVMQIDAECAN